MARRPSTLFPCRRISSRRRRNRSASACRTQPARKIFGPLLQPAAARIASRRCSARSSTSSCFHSRSYRPSSTASSSFRRTDRATSSSPSTVQSDGSTCRGRRLYSPFLLVNMGSGVSVLRVSGPEDFKRVGGTACGGATFLGLGRALVGCSDFDELMELASKGDESRVDKSVGDIYGESGCVDLGMPAKLTAASFGRLATERLKQAAAKRIWCARCFVWSCKPPSCSQRRTRSRTRIVGCSTGSSLWAALLARRAMSWRGS